MTDHTPAPWLMLASPYDDGTPYCRISAGNPEIYERETDKGFQIAGIMSEADARLISSAPVLLSIARRWVAIGYGSWHPERYAQEKAELLADTRALIAKVEDNP